MSKMYGMKVRLPQHREPDVVRIAKAETVEKLSSSVMQAYFMEIPPARNPRVRVRVEPKGIALDLIVEPEKDGVTSEYLEWRIQSFQEGNWRVNVPDAIAVAIDRWTREEYDRVVMADDQRVWLEGD